LSGILRGDSLSRSIGSLNGFVGQVCSHARGEYLGGERGSFGVVVAAVSIRLVFSAGGETLAGLNRKAIFNQSGKLA
jgi:hypothetical protein